MTREFKPRVRFCADSSESGVCFGFCVSLSLCPSLTSILSFSFSKINKNIKKFFLKPQHLWTKSWLSVYTSYLARVPFQEEKKKSTFSQVKMKLFVLPWDQWQLGSSTSLKDQGQLYQQKQAISREPEKEKSWLGKSKGPGVIARLWTAIDSSPFPTLWPNYLMNQLEIPFFLTY